jgi:hypothetical protein
MPVVAWCARPGSVLATGLIEAGIAAVTAAMVGSGRSSGNVAG